ncbi:uncharacterized protein LOC112350685 [Selaginella moellendorffii]|uniref:uncharacterized protein LOC112350685 n=1 Tax=Selaginella moellendorffii TaxID=88036 RepID=UPI000D1CF959|nr:uncharacterized protein LOC112350685 [Selaginella moellendorffii]|eukprot:XP_024543062.1 uncharacterized protein LOC112350685 [Selaginella moellendorffii]
MFPRAAALPVPLANSCSTKEFQKRKFYVATADSEATRYRLGCRLVLAWRDHCVSYVELHFRSTRAVATESTSSLERAARKNHCWRNYAWGEWWWACINFDISVVWSTLEECLAKFQSCYRHKCFALSSLASAMPSCICDNGDQVNLLRILRRQPLL